MKNKKELQIYKKSDLQKADLKNSAWLALSEASRSAYQTDFNLFFNFIGKDAKEIVAGDVLKFIEHLEHEGYRNSSINRKIASLSKMFKVLVLAGEIEHNPVETLRELKNITYKTFGKIQVSLTLEDIKKATVISKKQSQEENNLSLFISMLAKTGMRISEVCSLKNKDIKDFDKTDKEIRIVGKGRKERFNFIDNDYYNKVKAAFPDIPGMDYLFYRRQIRKGSGMIAFDRVYGHKLIRERFQKATGKDIHPHSLRHWFITYKIFDEKQDIKAVSLYVGHFSSSFTLDKYVDTALSAKDAKIKI